MGLKVKFFLKILSFWIVATFLISIASNIMFGDEIFSKMPMMILLSLITGGICTYILIVTQRRAMVDLGISNPSIEDVLPVQKSYFETSLSPLQLFEKLHANLFFGNKKIAIQNDVIEIKTEWGDESGGEIIRIIPVQNSKYLVISQPKFFLTLIDGGRNYKNVQRLKGLV